jgi:hypothetical protein
MKVKSCLKANTDLLYGTVSLKLEEVKVTYYYSARGAARRLLRASLAYTHRRVVPLLLRVVRHPVFILGREQRVYICLIVNSKYASTIIEISAG